MRVVAPLIGQKQASFTTKAGVLHKMTRVQV
jgi:hypothetical protein